MSCAVRACLQLSTQVRAHLALTTMTPTPLDVLSYLTDATFMSLVGLLVVGSIALNAINKIGGRR